MVLLGADASRQRLGQLAAADQLRQFRYLYLATHGVMNNRIALYSALILAQEPSPEPPHNRPLQRLPPMAG